MVGFTFVKLQMRFFFCYLIRIIRFEWKMYSIEGQTDVELLPVRQWTDPISAQLEPSKVSVWAAPEIIYRKLSYGESYILYG